MKGVVLAGDRRVEFVEFPDPAPGPGEVVLEIKASGMCGSDLKFYRAAGGAAALGFKMSAGPVIAGHEPCGVVVAVGSGVSEREARVRRLCRMPRQNRRSRARRDERPFRPMPPNPVSPRNSARELRSGGSPKLVG